MVEGCQGRGCIDADGGRGADKLRMEANDGTTPHYPHRDYLRLGIGNGDFLHGQQVDPVGHRPRSAVLAVCDLRGIFPLNNCPAPRLREFRPDLFTATDSMSQNILEFPSLAGANAEQGIASKYDFLVTKW